MTEKELTEIYEKHLTLINDCIYKLEEIKKIETKTYENTLQEIWKADREINEMAKYFGEDNAEKIRLPA